MSPFHYRSTPNKTKTGRRHFVILCVCVIFVHDVIRFSEARRTNSQIERLHRVVILQSIHRNRGRSHEFLVFIHHQHAFLFEMIHNAVVKLHLVVLRVVPRGNHEPGSVIIHFNQQSLTITTLCQNPYFLHHKSLPFLQKESRQRPRRLAQRQNRTVDRNAIGLRRFQHSPLQ